MKTPMLNTGIRNIWLAALLTICFCSTPVAANADPEATDEVISGSDTKTDVTVEQILELPLEELLKIEVFTSSRSNLRQNEIASAIIVVTSDDIRRSGATSIPEALRTVPGLQVSRFDSNKWNVSIRGFNWLLSDKLLVMVDGRSVYTPQFGGVWWDIQDTVMEDIERIEIIRGPGASLWGANAVNGVINILTKPASKTRSTLAAVAYGSDEKSVTLRQGLALGNYADFRLYAKGFRRDNVEALPGGDDSGIWQNNQAGFRLDSKLGKPDSFTLQGDIFNEHSGNATTLLPLSLRPGMTPSRDEQKMYGGNVLGRWKHTSERYGDLALQSYFDYTHRALQDSGYNEGVRTIDLDLQHNFALNVWNHVTWGMGYRNNNLETTPTFRFSMTPNNLSDNLWSLFVQDEVLLLNDKLRITLGSKFEHNDATGVEIQPSLRALWSPDQKQSYWAAVSRSVRTPSWLEQNGRGNLTVTPARPPFVPFPLVTSLIGNRNLIAEELIAWEAGYRSQISHTLKFDLAGFFNRYNHLSDTTNINGCNNPLTATPSLETTYGTPNLLCKYELNNQAHATTYGLELAAEWQPIQDWRLHGGYSWLNVDFSVSGQREKADPNHQLFLRSSHDFSRHVSLDWTLRYVDASPGLNVSQSYFTLDLRLAWKPVQWLELAVVGRNLTDPRHKESGSMVGQPQTALPVVRDVFGTVRVEF